MLVAEVVHCVCTLCLQLRLYIVFVAEVVHCVCTLCLQLRLYIVFVYCVCS